VASVSVTIDSDARLPGIVRDLKALGTVEVERGKAIVCAVGGSLNAAGVAGRMFSTLGAHDIPVEMISQASAGVSLTFVVSDRDAERAIRVLHEEYVR
jgi:aspartate kinase